MSLGCQIGTSMLRQMGTSLGRQIETSSGRQIGMSPERQLGTSPGWSNRLFKGRSGNAGVGHPWDQHFATGIV